MAVAILGIIVCYEFMTLCSSHTHSCTKRTRIDLTLIHWIQHKTYINGIANFLKFVECNNLFEIVEEGIAGGVVRKVGDGSRARPRNNGSEEDTDEDCTPHAVHHQENGEDTKNLGNYCEFVNPSMQES